MLARIAVAEVTVIQHSPLRRSSTVGGATARNAIGRSSKLSTCDTGRVCKRSIWFSFCPWIEAARIRRICRP